MIEVKVYAPEVSLPGTEPGIELPPENKPADPWDELFSRIRDGSFRKLYSVGDGLEIKLGKFGDHMARIVAMDKDVLNVSGKTAPLSFMLRAPLSSDGKEERNEHD